LVATQNIDRHQGLTLDWLCCSSPEIAEAFLLATACRGVRSQGDDGDSNKSIMSSTACDSPRNAAKKRTIKIKGDKKCVRKKICDSETTKEIY